MLANTSNIALVTNIDLNDDFVKFLEVLGVKINLERNLHTA